jgi:Ser/Thr protein kinase RdoA (MazF antagonist)
MQDPHPFSELTPDFILLAVESLGWVCDGRLLPLNSYENRVYQVGIEASELSEKSEPIGRSEPIVVKFYRPQRWSLAQIQEEHEFVAELAAADLPVVPPIASADGTTLHYREPFHFAVFPRRGGRLPELDLDTLHVVGRLLGKLHSVGNLRGFEYRPQLSLAEYGDASAQYLLQHDFIPADVRNAYESLASDLLKRIGQQLQACSHVAQLRLHGDCHPGNILWRDGPLLVDFDDCQSGPAVQDLWMLLSGERDQQQAQLSELIDGYNTFFDFDPSELVLIESLRTLRLMHYSAWLARRWNDPAFPKSFPWFNTPRYWSSHILQLREQLSALDEPPLRLF